ncbi:MAG: hypothetical protein AAFV43_08840 [Planctomycetota bacterium]
MSDNIFPSLGPSDSGLLDAPKTPAYVGGRPQIERDDHPDPGDAEAMSDPVPAEPADLERLEASLRDAPLPEGLAARLHRAVDKL